MSNAQHTRGPWHDMPPAHYTMPVRIRSEAAVIAVVQPQESTEERDANSFLIAAVPDLLSACEAMLHACGSSENWNGETHEALKLIESAISKARGA